MKIIFAGTPAFAAVTLEALVHSTHQVVAVYTQPDRQAGRGLKLAASAVKEVALQYQLPLHQPLSLKSTEEQEKLANLQADVMVVAAYGMLLPAAVLTLTRLGCINIHPSLLPRWRGAAPIQRAIFAGDEVSGVSIMQMDEGLDTGPVLQMREYTLQPDETAQSLHDILAQMGASALLETLDLLAENAVKARKQNADLAIYAHKISKEEALLDWTRPAIELEREIRAFNPWPVAYTSWQGQNLRIWQAKSLALNPHSATPRTILQASAQGIDIVTGAGVLRLLQVQLPGGKVMSVSDFYNARRNDLIIGQHFL